MKWAEVMTEKHYQGSAGKPPTHHQAMNELKIYFTEEQIVEISFVCGFFNFWNRFTDSLEIDIEDNPVMSLFTKSTAVQYGQYGIRANSIHPGAIDTQMIAHTHNDREDVFKDLVPLQRIAQPIEVAYGALYLASDESSYVTGSELVIDGGLTAK